MTPLSLPTGKMAKLLGVSADFLRKNKDVIFKKGIHYTTPQGFRGILWKVDNMVKWAEGDTIDNPFQDVLNEL